MKARLLVIEDDPGVREALCLGLELEGFAVASAASSSEGLRLLQGGGFDLLVLDVMLPGSDGYSVLRELRAGQGAMRDMPVIMLTARDEVEDRVRGLKAGADDYLVKPYALEELVARAEALLRRSRPEEARLVYGDLALEPARLMAWRGGRELALSPKTFALLRALTEHAERLVGKEALMKAVWGEVVEANTLEVHVSSLRRALGDPPLIHTVRGYGYRLGVRP